MAVDGRLKLRWQIKTAKTDIEELTARISKADGKAEAPGRQGLDIDAAQMSQKW